MFSIRNFVEIISSISLDKSLVEIKFPFVRMLMILSGSIFFFFYVIIYVNLNVQPHNFWPVAQTDVVEFGTKPALVKE